MLVFRRIEAPSIAERRPAVTLGVFDGVHRGHRKIIAELGTIAREKGVPTLAVTFSSHPRPALGRSAPPMITSLENRLKLLEEAGLDAVWILEFTRDLAAMPGKDFADEYFHLGARASAVVLGEAAHFGFGRDGGAESLAAWSRDWDMPVHTAKPLVIEGVRVSSTAVRLAVQAGNLERARHFLGRRFSMIGTVVHGQGLAKSYGFPTLNLDPHHELRPPAGVYLTLARVAESTFPSITNVGRPPTEAEIESGLGDFLVETHLLDYDGDLYGHVAEVFFVEKTRDVALFAKPDDLIAQVEKDLAMARRWFTRRGSTP